MPRSSRHKSHKQHKHSSKETREYSDSEEVSNFKERKDREEVVVRVSRESGSSEKRKLASDGKEVPGNGEEYSASKRRKERSGVDRWNGGEAGKGGNSVGDKGTKVENSRIDSDKGLKSKVSVDSKSNKSSSRKHESSSEKKEKDATPVLVMDSEEVKRSSSSSKVDSKSKTEKESSRKEVHQYKDSKDKEHVVERSSKAQDVKRERSVDKGSGKGTADGEGSRKQSSGEGSRKQSSPVEEGTTKLEVGNTELMQEDLRNPKLDKELEKQTRRKRDGSDEKDKYPEDSRDSNGRRLSARDERHKEEKHKEDRYKDKYREDLDRDHRNRDDRVRDGRTSKDHISDRSDTRHSRDENKSTVENRHKKSKTQNSDHDGSSHLFDDRASRYKDYRGKKRSSDDEDRSDPKTRNSKEYRYEAEKKVSSGKLESRADRGRSQSRLDVDSTVNGRRKSSPSSGSHFPKDNFRHSSKQTELKYKDCVSDERVRATVNSSREHTSVSGVVAERASESRPSDKPKSVGKPIHKDKNHLAELSSERSPIPEAQVSPLQVKEKSHSSTSIERRPSNRTPVRRSVDVDETGHRSFGCKDMMDYSSAIEERGSQEWPLEKLAAEEFPQADGDTVSVSSSFNRTSHLPTSSSSGLPPPPPFRTGVDSPSVFSSYEEDIRGKSSNRYKRSSDSNVARGQGNAWKGSPNAWPTSVTNGYPPFHQGPPPGGYHHPMMQQFHGPPVFGVRPSMELNPTGVSYHIPDCDRYSGHGRSFGWRNRADETCPPHLQGWDGSNGGFGDESHMHGKPDWDQNRHMMSDRGWVDANAEMWKGQNNGQIMDYSSTPRKEDNQLRAPLDEVWAGKPGQRSRNDRSRSVSRAESIEIKIPDDILPDQVPTEAPKQVVVEKTSEPLKIVNANRFCHVYLSKLDISLDLTPPELYNQCRSLLNMDGFSSNDDVAKDISAKGSGKAGVMISRTFSSAPFFPKIKDSVFQRAMSLYKKQGEERKAKFPASSRPKAVPSSNDGEELCPDPFPKVEEQELIPATVEMNVEEELVPDVDAVKGNEVVKEKVEDPVPTCGQVIAAEEKKDDEACKEQHVEKMDDAMENMVLAEEQPHSTKIGDCEEKKATLCGFLGVVTDDGSEALAPMSVECKSVNLSRILNSPESTH